MNDFQTLIQSLADAEVDFVVIGGFAAVAHGASRLTRDLDLCAPLTAENLSRLLGALAPFHPAFRIPGRPPQPLTEPPVGYRNLYLHTDLGELDVLSEVTGVGSYEQVAARSLPLLLWGRSVRLLSLEGIIAAKQALGRDRDRDALPELELLLTRKKTD